MQQVNSHHDWNPPVPLQEDTLRAWPENVFPEPFELFAKELARSTETPIELAAMLTLAAIATASHKRYKVQIKADYFEPVNLWPVIILPPASRKSRVYNEVTFPLRKWESEQKEILEPQIQSVTSKRKTMETRLKELRSLAAKADESKYKAIQENIELLEKELCEIPTCPQIWTSDVTPEHLATIMASNDEAMAVLSDEGGIFDILSGLYSDGKANIDLFLQAHSASPVRVDRGSRPPIFMQNAILTMGLTVQPEVIKNICRNKTFRGRGLLGRFLFAMPKSNIGTRSFEEAPINKDCLHLYREALRAILNHPDNVVDEEQAQYSLKVSPEAYDKWLTYAKTIEAMMGEEIDCLSHITDWAGKLPGAIGRIAALLHIMRHAYGYPWLHQISFEDMASAVKIGHTCVSHALAVFDLLNQDNAQHVAKTVYQWLLQNRKELFTRRECLRRFRRFKKDELQPALEILKEHEILREVEVRQEKGRPSDIFAVNPHLFEK